MTKKGASYNKMTHNMLDRYYNTKFIRYSKLFCAAYITEVISEKPSLYISETVRATVERDLGR